MTGDWQFLSLPRHQHETSLVSPPALFDRYSTVHWAVTGHPNFRIENMAADVEYVHQKVDPKNQSIIFLPEKQSTQFMGIF